MRAELCPCQLVWLRITSITIDAVQDDLELLLREALKFVACEHCVWKADNQEIASDCDADRRSTLDAVITLVN